MAQPDDDDDTQPRRPMTRRELEQEREELLRQLEQLARDEEE